MGTALAAGLMKAVLPKLSATLGEEVKLDKGLKQQIKLLTKNLQIIQDFLSAAEHHVVDTMFLKEERHVVDTMFLNEARELSYDVEDLMDLMDLLMLGMEGERALTPHGLTGSIQKLFQKNKIANKLHALRSRVMILSKKVIKLRDEHKFNTAVSNTSSVSFDPRVETSILLGVDGPRDELARLLMEKESESAERLKVVTIVGPGGLGKTTLAQQVYHKTKEYFERRAWAYVSDNPDLKNLLINILCQLGDPHSTAGDSERDLIRKIQASLQHKRYLIVLDDIWSSETWKIIKSGLPWNNVGSRIIATTRMNSVAKSCCLHWNDYIYDIKPLSEMNSKKLFHGRIFGSTGSCPPDLVDVADKIVKKCSGLPLAIITVSSLLASKPYTMLTWENVYNSLPPPRESMDEIKKILLLSYFSLPHHLKTCFLYLSVFPRDYVINRDCIISLWIAEGFISGNHERTLEEVGESYLNELINRSMMQPLYGSYYGKPEACRVHDLMVDLIRSKSSEENFVTLLDNGLPLSVLHRKIRRLSIINIKEDHYHRYQKQMDTSHIRTLFISGSVGPKLSFEHFTFLRILDLKGCKDLKDDNVKEIAQLKQLRYLSIQDTPISKLPEKIGNLRYLRTLFLQGCEVEELPMSLVRLRNLEYLHCDKMRFPEQIGKLTALSSLSQFDIFQSKILAMEELGNLSLLTKLELWWSPDIESNKIERYEDIVFSLYRLKKLQSLSIHGSDSSVDLFDHMHHPLRWLQRIKLNRSCYLSRMTEWFRSLPSITYICIDIKEVKNEDMQLFSELPSLLYLSLSSKEVSTEKLVISSNGFPVLQVFHLHSVRADLTFEPQAMQKLEELLLSLHVLPEETYGFSFSIDLFMCLKKIDIRINGEGADTSHLFKAADVEIRKAAENHPNHPTVSIVTLGTLVDCAAKEGKENEQKLEPIKDK